MNDADAKRLDKIRQTHLLGVPRGLVEDVLWLVAQIDQLRAEAGPWLRLRAWVDAGGWGRQGGLVQDDDGVAFRLAAGAALDFIQADTIDEALAEAEKRWGDG